MQRTHQGIDDAHGVILGLFPRRDGAEEGGQGSEFTVRLPLAAAAENVEPSPINNGAGLPAELETLQELLSSLEG
jgi:hypothetical protein